MVTLAEIEPSPISSVLVRNWRADAPPWIALVLVALPALFLSSPYNYLFIALGVATGIVTDFMLSRLRERWRIRDATTPPADYPKPVEFDPVQRAEVWQSLTANPAVRSLVLFSYGTCIVITDEIEDSSDSAKQLLSQYGHAIPGTPSGDMLVYELPESSDFVVGGHHPNILTYVTGRLFDEDAIIDQLHTSVAFLGRDFRCLDTFTQKIVHVKTITN